MYRGSLVVAILLGAIVSSLAAPQYVDEAVRQAAALNLLPHDAAVDKVGSSIEVAYIQLNPHERLSLQGALGNEVPYDVLSSLEAQIDQIGKNGYSQ